MVHPLTPVGLPHSEDREQTARDRDAVSEANDRTSDERDSRSEARDQRAEARESHAPVLDPGAATDRVAARRDRQSSATDRLGARNDRAAAAADRQLAARERSALVVDGLTAAHLRGPGLAELARDITRAKRTGEPFVLAFVDVDGLKAVNDTAGHLAGDELLKNVVRVIRESVREYDLIVRYGGDEFLCGLMSLDFAEARLRFEAIRAGFETDGPGSFSVGLVELLPDDDLESLVTRADDAMYQERKLRRAV